MAVNAAHHLREDANTILTGGGDYLLAVKDNQPTLHRDLQTTFDEAADSRQRTVDEQPRPPCEVTQDVDKGHGRVESRTVTLCRDLAFREDEARHRAKNTAQNMTTLRHFALNIIKSDPDRKLGVANTRKRAGWDRDYLIKLLTNA